MIMTADEARKKMVLKAITDVLENVEEGIKFGEMNTEVDISLDDSLHSVVLEQLRAAGYLLAVLDRNSSGMSLNVSWKD